MAKKLIFYLHDMSNLPTKEKCSKFMSSRWRIYWLPRLSKHLVSVESKQAFEKPRVIG